MVLLTMLAVVTVAIVRQRNLFGVVVLTSIYSFLMAGVLIVLDAVDVAMTEASVGAGVSTVLLLAALHLIKSTEMRSVRPSILPLFMTAVTGGILVWGSLVLPPFGIADKAIHNHVAPRYLSKIDQGNDRSQRGDRGAGRLPQFRHAWRDRGDLHRGHRCHAAVARRPPTRAFPPGGGLVMSLDLILQVGTKLVLPFILLFALYVQFHGDFGPGGGFQAGVIAAGMVILLAITFGLDAAQRIAPPAVVDRLIPIGVLLYAGTGVVGMILGKNFLDYSVLSQVPAQGRHLGIFLVEAGVLVTVASTMTALFYAFVERGR